MIDPEIIETLIQKESDESPSAYNSFLFYANLPENQRNTPTGMEAIATHSGLSIATVKSYRASFRWESRANAIDAYLWKLSFQKKIELMEENNKNFTDEMREIQQTGIQTSKKVLAVANELLDTFAMSNKTIETEWVEAKRSNGVTEKVPLQTVINMEAKVGDIAPLVRIGMQVPLLAMGLPTETIRFKTLETESTSEDNMSDDEIEKRINEINKQIKQIETEQ